MDGGARNHFSGIDRIDASGHKLLNEGADFGHAPTLSAALPYLGCR